MRWFARRPSRDQELDDEIEAHLAIDAKQRMESRGLTHEQAQSAARRDFGNIAIVKEVTRATWGFAWIESLAQDFRYAVRTMRKAPGFTLVAILTLALGIGANTAIFSVVDAALLRPLPFPGSDRLVRISATRNGTPVGSPSPLDIRDILAASHNFEGLLAYDHWRKNVSGILGSNQPQELVIGLVPGSYFELLRIKPLLGRIFSAAESIYGRHYVAIINSSFWRSRFASDPRVLGRTLRINGETYTIVAVIPDVIPGWMDQTTAPISIWTPFSFPDPWNEKERGGRGFLTLGRLKPGISYEQANAEVAAIAARLARQYPVDRGVASSVEPLSETRAGSVRPVLLLLCGAVAMVFMIACANLASLLLARNSTRYREMSVRAALGAGRGRLLRQVLLEALLVALAGGIAGLGVAAAAGLVLMRMSSAAQLPYTAASNAMAQFWSAAPEPRALLYTLGISLLTAILAGVGPAFTGTRVSLADTLREGGRTGAAGAARQRFRRMLVIAEVALSLVLLIAASLLGQTMILLQDQDPGFRVDRLLLAHIYIPAARYPDPAAISNFCDAFANRLRGVPGVVDASVTTGYPPTMPWQQVFTIPGKPVSALSESPVTRFAGVDEHYLTTMGFTLLSGRDFMATDTAAGRQVAIVNQEFVRRNFPDVNPLGREIRPGPPPGIEAPPLEDFGGNTRNITIIGVVRNFMNDGMARPPAPQMFTLFRQQPGLNFGFKDLVVRTAVKPENLVPSIWRELRWLDPEIPLGEIRTMQDHMSSQTADTRFTTLLIGLFAALGTILAVIGAYGVVAYLVAQRTQEMGVRLALGATSSDILWLVLRSGLFLGVVGVTIGIAGAMFVRQFLAHVLYRVPVSDPFTFAAASILLIAVIVAAGAIPAMRAMQIDPVQALRCD